MTIDIQRPELEQFVRDEIMSGHFQNVDELMTEALNALREKSHRPAVSPDVASPRKNLAQFLLESPFAGSDLNLERAQDYGRPINL